MQAGISRFQDCRADCDVHIHRAVEPNIEYRSTIIASWDPFDRVDDFHCAALWRAGNGAARKCRGDEIDIILSSHKLTGHDRHEMVHIGVGFAAAEHGDLDRKWPADAR